MDHQLGTPQSFSISTATWVPAPSANLTGTLNIANGRQVLGTNTTFGVDVQVGDWLLNPNTNEVQQVDRIDDATTLYLQSPFLGSTSTTATCKRIKPAGLRELKVAFVTAAGTLRWATQALGSDAIWPVGALDDLKFPGRLDPVLITPGGGGTASIQIVI